MPRQQAPASLHKSLDMLDLPPQSITQVITSSNVDHPAKDEWKSWPRYLKWLMEEVASHSDTTAHDPARLKDRKEEIKAFLTDVRQTPAPIMAAIRHGLSRSRYNQGAGASLDDFLDSLTRKAWTETQAWKEQSDPNRDFVISDESNSDSDRKSEDSDEDSEAEFSSDGSLSSNSSDVEQEGALSRASLQKSAMQRSAGKRKRRETDSPSATPPTRASTRTIDITKRKPTTARAQRAVQDHTGTDDVTTMVNHTSEQDHIGRKASDSQRNSPMEASNSPVIELCVYRRTSHGGLNIITEESVFINAMQLNAPNEVMRLLKTACSATNPTFFLGILTKREHFKGNVHVKRVGVSNIKQMCAQCGGDSLIIVYGDTMSAAYDMVTHVVNAWKGESAE